ncbi:MAG: RsmE family RNA methyltransferase [Terriglobia bacterium]
MARRRFFVDRICNGVAQLTGDDAHHLTRVLRVESGQQYEISDGAQAWLATVTGVHKSLVEFAVEEELELSPPPVPVALYLALIKFDRFEWAVEKATELGVARIVPVECARSDRGLLDGSRKRVERWRRIAREASEQSRRLTIPEIDAPARLPERLSDSIAHRIWLDEQPGAPPLLRAFGPNPVGTVALIVGPEGGWTSSERDAFSSAGWIAASLGHAILRTETAVCAGLALISQLL